MRRRHDGRQRGERADGESRYDAKDETKFINLAARRRHPRRLHLGVLDRLIEDDRIGFDGISASAGAMSATLFASRNGRRPSTGLPGTRSPKTNRQLTP
jgi:hypothetical protein